MVLIQHEIYLIDGLFAKILISTDIMKPENIILDLATDIIIIGICQSFRIPIVAVTKKVRTNAATYCTEKIMVPVKTSIAIPVATSKLRLLENPLLDNRNLFFEFRTLDILSIYVHIIDCHMNQIIIKNDTETTVTFPKIRNWSTLLKTS